MLASKRALLHTAARAASRRGAQSLTTPPAAAAAAASAAAGYHHHAMPWTPPSASWWATRKRPSSSLGSLNFPHVAPDPLADPSVFDEINTYSLKRQTGVSLKTLLDTGA